MMREPFWEETYADESSSIFGDASREIVAASGVLPRDSRVLDMGCGEGRNALFLARAGFRVDAFDISERAVSKMLRSAEQRGIEVTGWVEDMTRFRFRRQYDLIISHGVLHLLQRDDWRRVIDDMQAHTRSGGANVVAVFVDTLPTPEDLIPFVRGLFRPGELAGLYSGWDVELSESYIKEDEHPNGLRHRHPIDKVVAWKR
ncbi:MAG: methyltransferase domain-containing protein [Bacillota bacterium]